MSLHAVRRITQRLARHELAQPSALLMAGRSVEREVVNTRGSSRVHAALLPERRDNRLSDPPDGIARKADAAAVVEPFRCPDQSHVALGDQILERHSEAPIALGHRNDETEVGGDQSIERRPIPRSSPPSQGTLLIGIEQGMLANLSKIESERIL